MPADIYQESESMRIPLREIKTLPWRDQCQDTYRVLFFSGLICLLVLTSWVLQHLMDSSIFLGPMMGACIGMLPSLWLGTPASMSIADAGDREKIDVWMLSHRHIHDERGWVPKLPRALYFDSQIVRYEGNNVIGPLITLRKLRSVLRAESILQP